MHRAYLFIATILLGIAAFSFTAMAMSLPTSNRETVATSHQEQIVRRFYEAVNHQIRTGDSSALLEVLHPDFRDQSPLPGLSPGTTGLVEYVDDIHLQAPESSIEIETIAVAEDQVIAMVNTDDSSGVRQLGSRFETSSSFWNPVEQFRVSGDLIFDRCNPNRDLAILHNALEVRLEVPDAQNHMFSAVQLTFDKGGSGRFQTTAGPAILFAISGEFAITTGTGQSEATFTMTDHDQPQLDGDQIVQAGDVLGLKQGALLGVPPDAQFVVTGTSDSATALYVSSDETSPLGPPMEDPSVPLGGINYRPLGWFPVDSLPAGFVELQLERITLTSGGSIADAPVSIARPALIWLSEGEVLTELRNPVIGSIPSGSVNQSFASGVRLDSGNNLAYDWMHGAALHNTAEDPAIIWVVSMTTVE